MKYTVSLITIIILQ